MIDEYITRVADGSSIDAISQEGWLIADIQGMQYKAGGMQKQKK